MKLTILSLVTIYYLLMGQHFLKVWLKFVDQDTEMSAEERHLSVITLIVGTVFWPIVVPIAYLTLLKKKLASQTAICKNS